MISLCLCRIGLVCVLLQLLVAAKVYNCLLSPLSSFLPIYRLQLRRISFSRFSSWCSFCWCCLAEQPVLQSSLLLFCHLVLLACCLLLLLVLRFLFPPLVPCFFLSHLRFLLQLFLALFLPALLPLPSCFLCSPLSSLLFLLLLHLVCPPLSRRKKIKLKTTHKFVESQAAKAVVGQTIY